MSELPQDEISQSEVRRSLALAAAYGIGPFKKRVKLVDPDPFDDEPIESYTNFTIDVHPPKKEWAYEGKLSDSAVEILKTRAPLPHSEQYPLGQTYFIGDAAMSISPIKTISLGKSRIKNIFKEFTEAEFFGEDTGASHFANGFTFCRNGMNYEIQFFKHNSNWEEVNNFSISTDPGPYSFIHARPMTKDEAEYALDLIESELPADQKIRFTFVLARLRQNTPMHTEPGDSFIKSLLIDKEDLLKYNGYVSLTGDDSKDHFSAILARTSYRALSSTNPNTNFVPLPNP